MGNGLKTIEGMERAEHVFLKRRARLVRLSPEIRSPPEIRSSAPFADRLALAERGATIPPNRHGEVAMVFTPEQKREWSKRPEVQARQREHERRYREKQNALKPAHCLQCGERLPTQRMFCTSSCKARHHRNRPGVADHLRQLQRDRYHADADYRAHEHSRSATWKINHPEARREERRRALLRKLIARYAEVISIDVVMRDLTYFVMHAADLQAAVAVVIGEIRKGKRQQASNGAAMPIAATVHHPA
jgi:hypothetical protein